MVLAWIVVVPAVGELMTTVHDPVVPDVLHVFPPTNVAVAPPEFVSESVTSVPAGALTKVVPGLTLTCTVSVWFVPVGFVAVSGVIWMVASTQVLVALSQLLVQPEVTFTAVPVVRVTVPLALVKPIAELACTSV